MSNPTRYALRTVTETGSKMYVHALAKFTTPSATDDVRNAKTWASARGAMNAANRPSNVEAVEVEMDGHGRPIAEVAPAVTPEAPLPTHEQMRALKVRGGDRVLPQNLLVGDVIHVEGIRYYVRALPTVGTTGSVIVDIYSEITQMDRLYLSAGALVKRIGSILTDLPTPRDREVAVADDAVSAWVRGSAEAALTPVLCAACETYVPLGWVVGADDGPHCRARMTFEDVAPHVVPREVIVSAYDVAMRG